MVLRDVGDGIRNIFDKSFDRYCTNLIMVQINAPLGNIIHKITDECIYTYKRVCVFVCVYT